MIDNSKKKELFLQTLTKAYNHQDYVRFLQELLNDVQLVAPTRFNKEFSSLSGIIAGHYHIGNYKGADGKKMALFAVQLKNKGNVDNARSSQRAFIKTLLDNSGCDGALAAFYTMEKDANGQERPSNKWRLSLIRMEYGFADGKLSTKLTPAKRYSYLVGEGEPCHTAQERLYGMFVQDEVNPGLAELEEAFSVETVTKQFFNDYKEKYLAVKEYLETTPDFMAEAKRCGFTSEQFTKKLMGQIVFLYFVQKKGWLGVSVFPVRLTEKAYKSALFRNAKAHNIVENVYSQPNGDGISFINREALFALSDEDAKFLSTLVKGKSWGEGPKNFMRALYESCVKQGRNYFDDYLEPLFYEALNVDRGESGFYARFHCRVPFLNGGLFEQLDNYDWVNSDFHIPNEMFSNAESKGNDEADGILDIFDRYNFTMAEDEPMEREVAIDPEMLGKVFENLLDVKDRKSKGAFYTPREIVHYMCQESLINYLTTNSGIEEADIRKFILYGEYFRDNDCLKTKEVIKNGKKSHMVDKARDLEMPESIFSFKQGVNHLKELDELLANVKIADPAVGSGAFLLGLLNEIVRARQTLTTYMTIEMNDFERFNFYAYGRKAYDLKVNTIKNCLFACDLEPSATDITKLRLWLSIVIDDELVKQDDSEGLYDAHTEPRPLPNLDCNIICGNSLMDEFEGIKLITESSILNNQSEIGMDSFYQAGFDNMLQELIKLQDELYFTKQHETKQEIKKKIHAIYDRIILHQLEGNPSAVEKYKEVKDLAQQPFILWQLYFPKVFMEKHGFDIAIGNPPYISAPNQLADEFLTRQREILSKNGRFKSLHSKWDVYIPFMELGIQLLHENGSFAMIVPYPLENQIYAKKMRNMLLKDVDLIELVDLKEVKVFEATVQNIIPVAIKRSSKHECYISHMYNGTIKKDFIQPHDMLVIDKKNGVWNLTEQKRNVSLYNNFHVLGDYCYISYGLRPNSDEKTAKGEFKKADLISDVIDGIPRREYLEGKDIEKYEIKRVRYLEYGTDRSPQKLVRPTFPELYIHPKLMSNVFGELKVALDIEGKYVHNNLITACVLWKSLKGVENKSISSSIKKFSNMSRVDMEALSTTVDLRYLLAVLNSSYAAKLLQDQRAGDYHIYPEHIRRIPIPEATIKEQDEIIGLVTMVLKNKNQDILDEIDKKVEYLYQKNLNGCE